MEIEILVCAIIIVYTLLYIKLLIFHQGFDPGRSKEIYENRDMFHPTKGSYKTAKRKMPWMDPVVYNDARELNMKKNFTIESLKRNLI